jgi:hypothetical protein
MFRGALLALVVIAAALGASTPGIAARAASSPGVAARAAGATFTNPVFAPDLPDPSIIRDAATGTWYAYGTTDNFSPGARAAGGNGTWTWLRIVKKGDSVTAYTSVDGHRWTPGATYNLAGFDPAAPLKIGILATAAGAPDPIPAHFAYVRVYRPQS